MRLESFIVICIVLSVLQLMYYPAMQGIESIFNVREIKTNIPLTNSSSGTPLPLNEVITNIKEHKEPYPPIIQSTIKKKKIAFAITITQDGPYFDGAAVLSYSVHHALNESLKYEADLIAFVDPGVVHREGLRFLGYEVIEKELPVAVKDIEGDFMRGRIEKNGCCGAKELLKLYAFTLMDYHRVVHLDMDFIIVRNFDELFDEERQFLYTTDPNMMTGGSAAPPVQGGFLVIKPNMTTYQRLVGLVREGDFRPGSGWKGARIGHFWGGMTIQGLLAYYFKMEAQPEESRAVDRCVYNTMVDVPTCRAKELSEVSSGHFTICQKPWNCWKQHKHKLCGELHMEWFRQRYEVLS